MLSIWHKSGMRCQLRMGDGTESTGRNSAENDAEAEGWRRGNSGSQTKTPAATSAARKADPAAQARCEHRHERGQRSRPTRATELRRAKPAAKPEAERTKPKNEPRCHHLSHYWKGWRVAMVRAMADCGVTETLVALERPLGRTEARLASRSHSFTVARLACAAGYSRRSRDSRLALVLLWHRTGTL